MRQAQLSSKWVIVLTLSVVVASFVGATVYAEFRASRTHALTAEIAANESPSIMHLAAARAELRDMQRLVTTHVLLGATGRASATQASSRAALARVRERLRANLDAYFALPTLPRERDLWGLIEKQLTEVDAISQQILDASDRGQTAEAQRLLMTELPTAMDGEAESIMGAIELNAAGVRHVADEIEGERRRRITWVFGLDGLSVVLAGALALIVLRMANREEALIRRRSEELEGFAGRVAHDLLNPISAAEMALSLADRENMDPERRAGALARGRRSLVRARRLIDDLLAFAQAARPSPAAAAHVREVVEGVVEELRPPALARGIRISTELPSAALCVRCADGVLASLLGNLVRNAIKHMHSDERQPREVRIRVTQRTALAERVGRPAGRDDANGVPASVVRFEVEDTGPGLPPAFLPHAFDPYVRGAGSAEPGLGLGLATVRRLVEGHRGRYGVQSRLGAGALFWFELPAAGVPAEPPGPDPLNREQHANVNSCDYGTLHLA
jgi:signal transduction histidine kinase